MSKVYILNGAKNVVLSAVSGRIQGQFYTGAPSQMWLLDSQGDGTFIIKNEGNG